MKKSLLGATFLLAANLAWADAVITLPTQGFVDPCQSAQGAWSGRGRVTTEIMGMPIDCVYHGEAQVPYIAESGELSMDIQMTKESGFCPEGKSFSVHGTCRNGKLHLEVEDANINGTVSADGRSADLSGTVGVDVLGQYVIANIESMHLRKK